MSRRGATAARLTAGLAKVLLAASLLAMVATFVYEDQVESVTAGTPPDLYSDATDRALLPPAGSVLLVAHNAGDSSRTLRQAFDAGAQAVEIDIAFVGGRLYAAHDQPNSWVSNRFRRTPSFETIWAQSTAAELVVLDLKSTSRTGVDELLTVVRQSPGPDIAVTSRSVGILRHVAARAPEITRLLSVSSRSALDGLLLAGSGDRDGIDGVAVRHTLLDETSVAALAAHRLTATAWTVNDAARLAELTVLGVPVVMTDNLAYVSEHPTPTMALEPLGDPAAVVS